MLKLENNKRFSQKFVWAVWLLMAFQAGYVNVGGFYTSGSFVSHVTGTSSNIGIGLAKFDMMFLLTFVTVLFAFIGGAAFAGNFIGVYKDLGRKPRYVLVATVKCVFFFMILLLSELDSQNALYLSQNAINTLIIFFLSFCCGVQNSTCALTTNGFLKPTHMTGLSTDIGINLVKHFPFTKAKTDEDREARKKNNLRLAILFSFIFGGVIASAIFTKNAHYGFIFPFLSALCFLVMGLIYEQEHILANNNLLRATKLSLFTIFFATLAIGVTS
jgi:uncharacterized membrane protein YoaK (UPF0700 family)